MHLLTFDLANPACTAAIVPKTTLVTTSTTRPFSRRFSTVAYFSPGGGTFSGAIRRLALPVGVVVTARPYACSSAVS